jgi:membrane-associated phospholipid phosphatase
MNASLPLADYFFTFDDRLASYFHDRTSDTFFIMWHFLSNIGHGRCIGIILGGLLIILGLKKRWYTILAILLMVPGMYLGELVKVIVHRTRPDPYIENGFSFPSGHALTATLAYGMILYLVWPRLKTTFWKTFASLVTAVLVCLPSFARVALGAHYLSDVVVAIAFGVVWLPLCLKMSQALERYMKNRRTRPKMVPQLDTAAA